MTVSTQTQDQIQAWAGFRSRHLPENPSFGPGDFSDREMALATMIERDERKNQIAFNRYCSDLKQWLSQMNVRDWVAVKLIAEEAKEGMLVYTRWTPRDILAYRRTYENILELEYREVESLINAFNDHHFSEYMAAGLYENETYGQVYDTWEGVWEQMTKCYATEDEKDEWGYDDWYAWRRVEARYNPEADAYETGWSVEDFGAWKWARSQGLRGYTCGFPGCTCYKGYKNEPYSRQSGNWFIDYRDDIEGREYDDEFKGRCWYCGEGHLEIHCKCQNTTESNRLEDPEDDDGWCWNCEHFHADCCCGEVVAEEVDPDSEKTQDPLKKYNIKPNSFSSYMLVKTVGGDGKTRYSLPPYSELLVRLGRANDAVLKASKANGWSEAREQVKWNEVRASYNTLKRMCGGF